MTPKTILTLSLTIRKADRDLAVGVANVDTTDIVDDLLAADDGGQWDEPETSYAAKYPYNHVYETEGGHIREYDDTIGCKDEYMNAMRQGTGYEIVDDGTKITRVKKDNYTLVRLMTMYIYKGRVREPSTKDSRVKVNASAEKATTIT